MPKNILFMVAVPIPGWEHRSEPYKYAIDAWKKWCNIHNVEMHVLTEKLYDHVNTMKVNYWRYYVHEFFKDTEYDQIAIIDADTIPHPQLPNFFELSEGKLTLVKADGDFDWIARSMENYVHIFPEEFKPFNIFDYFNSGFIILNKSHEWLTKMVIDFYSKNFEAIKNQFHIFGVGTDQPLLNHLVYKHMDVENDVTFLSYQFCMSDMARKNLLNNNLFLSLHGLYQFNAIPGNATYGQSGSTDPSAQLMKLCYDTLYSTKS